jgi:phosphopantothenoylcysteine decarboxylase / phosphopantothenate---cysteine ligase
MTISTPTPQVATKAKILLGVTGGIAAYKSCILLRLLKTAGHDVRVVLTKNAEKFVGPLTFSTLSGYPVYADPFAKGVVQSTEHIDLSLWADLAVVAPTTANLLGKLASGIADDFLSTLLCAFDKPRLLAPAMNKRMWKNAAVQRNVKQLQSDGVQMVDPEAGFLACGELGDGRMAEPQEIFDRIQEMLASPQPFSKKRILISAGPTCEDVDDVRYLTNRSTGKMGYALARAAQSMGADVDLVSGPCALPEPAGVHLFHVRSAAEMATAIKERHPQCDVLVMCAAVADYSPTKQSGKVKKTDGDLHLSLQRTEDILLGLGQQKGRRVHVGFAMQTDSHLQSPKAKLESKNLDLLCVNNTLEEGAGFAVDTNRILLLEPDSQALPLPIDTKDALAKSILERVFQLLQSKTSVEK